MNSEKYGGSLIGSSSSSSNGGITGGGGGGGLLPYPHATTSSLDSPAIEIIQGK
jgi:hypothetical protein